MPMPIIEDRVIARLAYEAAANSTSHDAALAADIAYGQAMVALRVSGVQAGPDILRALRADVDSIFADPAEAARARGFASRRQVRHSDADRPSMRRAVVG